jgi:rod shape-determining protein MreD
VSPAGKARLRVAGVVLAALYIEMTFGSDLRIWGVAPDLLCLVTVAAALATGPEQGAFCGFGCGLLADLYLTDTPFGLSALSFLLVGFVVGWFRAASPTETKLLVPPVVLVATAVEVGLFVALAGLFGQAQVTSEGRDWLIRVAVIESIEAAVLSLPAYGLLRRASRGSPGALSLGGPSAVTAKI